jgi:hypothetical protein
LAAGAVAKAGDVGGRAAIDAYDALRALIVRNLGKGGAVQVVEDEPRSETAQAALAEALTKPGLGADTELAQHAEALRVALACAAGAGGGDIDVGDITAKANVLVNNLVASGRIKLGDIRAETGDATLTNLTAGVGAPKKPKRRRAGHITSRDNGRRERRDLERAGPNRIGVDDRNRSSEVSTPTTDQLRPPRAIDSNT